MSIPPRPKATEKEEATYNKQETIQGYTLSVQGMVNDYFKLESDKSLEVVVLINKSKEKLLLVINKARMLC